MSKPMLIMAAAAAAIAISRPRDGRRTNLRSDGARSIGEGGSDEPVGDQEPAIGLGHPSEWILPNIEDLPDQNKSPLLGAKKVKAWTVLYPLNDPRLTPEYRGVPFATPNLNAIWPINTDHPMRLTTSYLNIDGWYGNSGRAFKRERKDDDGTKRWHAGVDLFGNEGDEVVVPEDARILTILPFHHGTSAVYLITADRTVINLGEVANNSWKEFKASAGKSVRQGDPVARIGRQTHGSTMIHFEMYNASGIPDEEMIKMIRNREFRWIIDGQPNSRLYDPTAYLLMAASRTYQNDLGIS